MRRWTEDMLGSSKIAVEHAVSTEVLDATALSRSVFDAGPIPAQWIARTLIITVAAGFAWHTWGHWGDFQIDNGRELYVPAAILRGKVLFRDLWYMYGPLAPYVKALLFRIFGVSLTVLYGFGLALVIGCALITFEVAREVKLELPISIVPPLFFLVEAFYPFIRNFIFPYSYAASLGATLGMTCLYFVLRYMATQREWHLGIASLLASLVILTKQEFGVACLALLAFAVVPRYRRLRSRGDLLRNAGVVATGLLPAVAGYGWFLTKVSARALFLENWIQAPGTYFMRTFGKLTTGEQGFRFIPAELLEVSEYTLLGVALWYTLAFVSAVAIEKLKIRSRLWMALPVTASMIPLAIASVTFFKRSPWGLMVDTRLMARSLWGPSVTRLVFTTLTQVIFPSGIYLVVFGFLIHAAWRFWRDPENTLAVQSAALGLYASLIGLRQMMELEPNVDKCAVYFNVPAFLIFVLVIKKVICLACRALEGKRREFVAAGMLSAEMVCLFILFWPRPQALPARLTTDYGSFYTRPDVAELFPQIIHFMKTHTSNGRDILVVPEPPSLYVFAGMTAPSRWYSLVPGYIAPEQEEEYINELKSNDVKYILIADRTFFEYGIARFTEGGYNPRIYGWITSNYERVGQFGPLPAKAIPPTTYEMWIYQRKGPGWVDAAARHSD